MELCQYFTVLNSRKLLPENSGEERGTGPTPKKSSIYCKAHDGPPTMLEGLERLPKLSSAITK